MYIYIIPSGYNHNDANGYDSMATTVPANLRKLYKCTPLNLYGIAYECGLFHLQLAADGVNHSSSVPLLWPCTHLSMYLI